MELQDNIKENNEYLKQLQANRQTKKNGTIKELKGFDNSENLEG